MSAAGKPLTITIEYSKCTAEPNAKCNAKCNAECNDECKAVKSKRFKVTTKTPRKELDDMIRDFVGEVLGRTLEDNDSLKFEEKVQNGVPDSVSIDCLLLDDATNKTYCVHVTRSRQVTTAGLGQDFLQAIEKVMEKPLKAFGELLVEQNNFLVREIRTIIRPESVNFSDLTENQANYKKLKDILNIRFMDMETNTMLPNEFVNRNKEFKFDQFDWGNRTEPQGSPDAINFLNETLKRVKVYGDTNKTRDLFNNNGFKFIDARSHLIGFSLEGTRYHGMVDCFITPFRQSDVDSSTQLRAFCEWKAYKDPTSVNLSTCRPQFFAELIAANYVSKHPVLGILTNLVNRFILAYIIENDNTNDNGSLSASSSNQLDLLNLSKKPKMMKSFIIQIFDTDSVKKQMDKPLEFACLFISYWLSQCSTNPLFADLKNEVNIRPSRNQDPYNLDFFLPLYNSIDHLREFFDEPNSDEGLGMFLEQMNSVCETAQERAEFIRNRLLSEFSSLYVQESPSTGFDFNSMYA